jgi:hypothetical protein
LTSREEKYHRNPGWRNGANAEANAEVNMWRPMMPSLVPGPRTR